MSQDQMIVNKSGHIPSLDGFRGLAIILVFTAHPANREFWGRFNGPSGVTLFFVLSGFLITTLLVESESRGRLSLKAFYIKRFFRIYPMYFLVTLLYIFLILGLDFVPNRRSLFLSELPYYLSPIPEHAFFKYQDGLAVPNNGLWSIGIEEKFYLFWPLIAFGGINLVRRHRLLVLIFVIPVTTFANYQNGIWAYFAPYLPIALGCIGALARTNTHLNLQITKLNTAVFRYSILIITMILQFSSHKVLMGEALYPFICILFLFSILAFSGPRNDRFLSSKILKYIAELSYSLYLTHNICINLAEKFITDSENSYRTLYSTGIAIVLALIAAHILNRFFERPLRDFGRRIARG